MKIIYLLCICYILTGCEKEDICWTCKDQYTNTYSDNRPADTTTFTSQVCNRTPGEIDDYEETGSFTISATSGGVTTVTTITVNCRR